MQISGKPLHKLTDSLLFLFITLVFLTIFVLTFKGFDGSDDMHYALLASQVLHHRFDPFLAGDIFTGRLGLIYWQALLYRVGGINPVMTQAGTLLASVLGCYLTIFKLAGKPSLLKVVIAASLFYFTPVLHASINGIYPDAYVMLGTILVIISMKQSQVGDRAHSLRAGLWTGGIIFLTCLFKEQGIILFAALGVFTLLNRTKKQVLFLAGAGLAAAGLFTAYGCFLWWHSGDFFLRLTQIRINQLAESLYPWKCHAMLSPAELLVRLTYGPWVEAVKQGYFPVLLSMLVLLGERVFRVKDNAMSAEKTVFLVLLFTVNYFPAHVGSYQPVCPDMRQYLLVLPFATVLLTGKFCAAIEDRRSRYLLAGAAAICLLTIVSVSLNKWKWLSFAEMIFLAGLTGIVSRGFRAAFAVIFLTALSFLGLERLFFLKSNWYYDLKAMYAAHGQEFCYLPDHDNFMQWRLFGGFADTAVVTLDALRLPADLRYAEPYAGYRPGWLIVNRMYSNCSPQFFSEINRFYAKGLLTGKMVHGDVASYRLAGPATADSLRRLMMQEPKR